MLTKEPFPKKDEDRTKYQIDLALKVSNNYVKKIKIIEVHAQVVLKLKKKDHE